MPSVPYKLFLQKEKYRSTWIWLVRLSILFFFLFLWQLAAELQWIDPLLTSKPSAILTSFKELFWQNELLMHTKVSAVETLVCIVISMGLGTLIAIWFWYSRFMAKVLDPYLVVLNALPKVALGPIFYIWLGDRCSIYGMGIAISLVSTILMIGNRFREISKTKLKLMESFGATKGQMMRIVLLPASVPSLISALKINSGFTLVGVIMGEFLSSKAGLGYLILYGGQVFQMNLVMASIMMLALLSSLLYGLVSLIERLICKKFLMSTEKED